MVLTITCGSVFNSFSDKKIIRILFETRDESFNLDFHQSEDEKCFISGDVDRDKLRELIVFLMNCELNEMKKDMQDASKERKEQESISGEHKD